MNEWTVHSRPCISENSSVSVLCFHKAAYKNWSVLIFRMYCSEYSDVAYLIINYCIFMDACVHHWPANIHLSFCRRFCQSQVGFDFTNCFFFITGSILLFFNMGAQKICRKYCLNRSDFRCLESVIYWNQRSHAGMLENY